MVTGPALPPHLVAKRKRSDDEASNSSTGSEDEGPQLPPQSDDASKKRRVMGPAPPPAPLDQRPPHGPSDDDGDSSSDEDDDYGPALPKTGQQHSEMGFSKSAFDNPSVAPPAEEKTKRDDWMMMPPTQDGLAAKLDPTKLRARGFNTGKGARAPKADGEGSATWLETPEQKRKRLENEVLGIKPSASEADPKDHRERAKKARDEEKARRIQKHNDEYRNTSLYDQHKGSSKKQEDDDPNKRVFDYEKDMSAAPRVTHAQKRDLLTKASDFGSRFSKGNYL